jgi:YHS domain-containing protein
MALFPDLPVHPGYWELEMMPGTPLLCGIMLAALAFGSASGPALADQSPAVYAPDGVALSGYDAVAYFTEGRPVRGHAENALRWHGAVWYFASTDSLMLFEMNPRAYAPQFGGYCAYSISEGQPASGMPEAFFIYKDRLYLLHKVEFLDEMKRKLPEIVARAEANWPEALGH